MRVTLDEADYADAPLELAFHVARPGEPIERPALGRAGTPERERPRPRAERPAKAREPKGGGGEAELAGIGAAGLLIGMVAGAMAARARRRR